MLKVLYKKDSKGKVRMSSLELIETVSQYYKLERKSGIVDGKLKTELDVIDLGKAGRTIKQQAELKFNSLFNKLQDKGYKTKEQYCELLGIEEVDFKFSLIPNIATTGSGGLKPMLAQPLKKELDTSKNYIAQPKLNGVRCNIYKEDNKIVARSRQGKDYSVSCQYIIQQVEEVFKKFPNAFLDGEIYIHGKSLQDISGWTRKQEPILEHSLLEFHMYDFVMDIKEPSLPYSLRNRGLTIKDKNVKTVESYPITSIDFLYSLEDKLLREGYEGVILRDPKGLYEFGKRSKNLIKLKRFIDEEFKIIGQSYGKREEDLIFHCRQEEGKEFKVKMTGTKEFKASLDLDYCIGKKLTVKYFERTKDNIPSHGVGLNIRDYE